VSFDVRPVTDLDEFTEAFLAIGQYFGAEPKEERMQRFTTNLPFNRMFAARENGRTIGGAGSFPLTMSVPGGQVPCAGVTVVGVYPTHRRRGVLRAMMRAQLDDVRARGEPIAALWASEEPIYTRFGYGMASLQGEIELPRERGAYALPFEPESIPRIVDTDEAKTLLPPIHERWAAETPGAFVRSEAWWEFRVLGDPPEFRDGAGPKRFVVLERDGEAVAYAIYRHVPDWEAGASTATLRVNEAIAPEPRGLAEIWRYVLDVDWTATIKASFLPLDHPLFLLLAEPRRLRFRVGDGLWVRLVDVGAALSARSYAEDGALVIEVLDDFLPDNAGVWKLDGGEARQTDEQPELVLNVRELGSAFLGGFTFAQLQRALRLDERVPGAVARADTIFRTDRAPWCPEIF
jgi:predicted acetyltransferase